MSLLEEKLGALVVESVKKSKFTRVAVGKYILNGKDAKAKETLRNQFGLLLLTELETNHRVAKQLWDLCFFSAKAYNLSIDVEEYIKLFVDSEEAETERLEEEEVEESPEVKAFGKAIDELKAEAEEEEEDSKVAKTIPLVKETAKKLLGVLEESPNLSFTRRELATHLNVDIAYVYKGMKLLNKGKQYRLAGKQGKAQLIQAAKKGSV